MARKKQNEFVVESHSDDSDGSAEAEVEEENVSEADDTEEIGEAGPSGMQSIADDEEPVKKKKKRGIIYISSIPKHMTVMILREMLNQYAKIGRVFLQPGKAPGKLSIATSSHNQIIIFNFGYFQATMENRKRENVVWPDISPKVGSNSRVSEQQN